MDVAYVIDTLASGGAQRQVAELAVYLRREAALRVSVLIYRPLEFHGDRLRAAGVPIIRLTKRSKYDPTVSFEIRRWMLEKEPDVLHAFLPWPSAWSYLAVRSMPRGRRPRFIAGERLTLTASTRALAAVQGWVYRGSDAVTVNAESTGAEIVRKLHVPEERIHYLPNGIDLDAWDRMAEAEPPVALEEGCFHLALVGGLREQKNHRLVLRALSALGDDRVRSWRVWFVGAESGGRAVAAGIRREIRQRQLESIVRIVPETERIQALMRGLHGVLLPSQYEGFPNVALEAMASRLPVIATAVGDVPNMIEDGVTGFIMKDISAESLERELLRLASLAAEQRRALGERARAVVEARYTMSRVAQQHLELYRSLAERRS